MRYLLVLGICILLLQQSVAPPVNKEKKDEEKDDKPEEDVNIYTTKFFILSIKHRN